MLLGLLREGPRSGYDLRRLLVQSPLRHFSSSPGAVYPALRRLAARGWVEVGAPGGGRGRQELRLNAGGRRAFGQWLRRPVTRDDVVLRPADLLLRCAWMDGVAAPATIRRFLKDYGAAMGAYADELRRYDLEHGPGMPPLARLVFQSGVDGYAAAAAWAKRALALESAAETKRKRRPGKRGAP